jgi:hypothetical protein
MTGSSQPPPSPPHQSPAPSAPSVVAPVEVPDVYVSVARGAGDVLFSCLALSKAARAENQLAGAEVGVVPCCFPSTAIVTACDDDSLSVEVAGGVAGRDGELAEEKTHGR